MVKRRLRRGGCLAWRQTAFTVEVDVPICRAIARADMPVGSRSSICCFFAALIGRQAVLRMPRAVVVSLTSVVDATLDVLDSEASSPAMRRLRKASRGSQLFGLMLPRCTDFGPRRHRAWGPDAEPFGGSRCLSHSSCWTTSKPRTSTFMPRRLSSSCPPAGRAALQRS